MPARPPPWVVFALAFDEVFLPQNIPVSSTTSAAPVAMRRNVAVAAARRMSQANASRMAASAVASTTCATSAETEASAHSVRRSDVAAPSAGADAHSAVREARIRHFASPSDYSLTFGSFSREESAALLDCSTDAQPSDAPLQSRMPSEPCCADAAVHPAHSETQAADSGDSAYSGSLPEVALADRVEALELALHVQASEQVSTRRHH
jgi:hypothetical protein